MRGYHDIGGQPAGPIDRADKVMPDWARMSEALRVLVDDYYCLHEQRRKIEELGADVYARLGYFELRITAMARMLVEKGMIGQDELDRRMQVHQMQAHQREGRPNDGA